MSINVAELEQLLRQLTLPDTQSIHKATEILNKNYFKRPECVIALGEILIKSQQPELRQLSAVLLRKRIVKLWSKIPPQEQEQMKKALLDSMISEPQAIVRHSTARLVAVVARYEVPAGKWAILLDFLYNCCNSNQAVHREVGMFVFSALVEPIGDDLRPHFEKLFALFAAGMKDPESLNVQVTAVEAASSLAPLLSTEKDIQIFRDLIPLMTQVIQNCLNKGDEESAIKIFEVFDELIECEVPVLARSVPVLVKTFLEIGVNESLEQTTRSQAINFVSWIIRYKKKAVLKNKLLEPIINTIFPLIGVDKPDGDEEDSSVSTICAQTIDIISLSLPPEQVVPIVSKNVQQYFQSPQAKHRRAALVALAVMIEGSSDYLRSHLKEVVNIVLAGLSDVDFSVRESACLAVEQLSFNVQPEINSYADKLLPALFQTMDASEKIQEKCCMALEAFCEQFGEGIIPYLNILMEKFISTLQKTSISVQETVISAIGSTAFSAKKQFLPYFPQVAFMLKAAMNAKNENEISLRAIATDTMGTLAVSVGPDEFRPYFEETMNIVSQGLQLKDSSVNECTWSFFSSLSKVYKAEFGRFLPNIMPLLFESCLSQDGFQTHTEEGEVQFLDDDEEDDDDEEKMMTVTAAFLHEKEIAISVIGDLFEHTQEAFIPYLEKSIEVLKQMVVYFDPDIKASAVSAFSQFMKTLHKLYDNYETWDSTKVTNVHQNILVLADYIIPIFIQMMSDEDERSVVTEVCFALSDMLSTIGPQIAEGKFEAIGVCVMQLLTKSSKCQTKGADESDEENEDNEVDEDEDAELDSRLIDSVAEVISSLSKVLTVRFTSYFQTFLPHILKYYKKSKPVADRSMAIGCISEVSHHMKESITPFADELANLFLRALSDEEEEVQNNATFGCGVLCESVGPSSSKYYIQFLQKIRGLMVEGKDGGLLDNCCATISRMILTSPANVPLDHVLPVLFSFLPIRQDLVENEVVYNCIFFLFSSSHPYVFSNLPQILTIFAGDVAQGKLTDATKISLAQVIKKISTLGDTFTSAMTKISPEYQQVIMAAISS